MLPLQPTKNQCLSVVHCRENECWEFGFGKNVEILYSLITLK